MAFCHPGGFLFQGFPDLSRTGIGGEAEIQGLDHMVILRENHAAHHRQGAEEAVIRRHPQEGAVRRMIS